MSSTVPVVRLRPAPAYEPPYDDEQQPDVWGSPAQPLLDLPPPLPGRQPPVRAPQRPDRRSDRTSKPEPSLGSASPAARVAATRFLHSCLEVLNGLRPAGHLRELSSPLAAASVVGELTQATRRLRRAIRLGAPGPAPARDGQPRRIVLRRMRVFEPRPGVVEVAAVIGTGHQFWAAAFRLERRGEHWPCVAAAIL